MHIQKLMFSAAIVLSLTKTSAAEPYDWSGLFIAAHFSGDSASMAGRFTQPNGSLTMPSSLSDVTGASYGLAIGNNWHLGNVVLGFEARWSGSSVNKSEKVSFGNISQTRKIEDLITIGPRLGFALNRFHVYGTAGIASSGYRAITTDASFTGGINAQVSNVNERVYGHFVGAGVEIGITKNIIVGMEFDRTNLNGVNVSWLDNSGDLNLFEDSDNTINSLHARIGVKF